MRTMASRNQLEPVDRSLASVPRADRLPVVMVALGVALLPLLRPKGPGNMSPEDLVMAGSVLTVLLWASATRAKLHVPYAIPVGIMVLAGCLAALFGIAPGAGVVAIVQDLFLLCWCAAVVSVCRKPAALSIVLRAWSWSAVGWATFLLAAVATRSHGLAGIGEAEGGRAALTFDHPNMAANYFLVSLFVVVLSRSPRNRLGRVAACAALLGALVVAGSNAALLGLPLAAGVAGYVAIRRYSDSVAALAVVLTIVLVGGAGAAVVQQRAMDRIERSENKYVKYSVGRSSRSASARQDLFVQEYELFRTGSLLGRGPASTKETLGTSTAPTAKEAHDDYLATLVERGALGFVGLMLLIGSIVVRAISVDPRRLSAEFRQVVPSTAPLVGALVAMAVGAFTHEILHYRHFWALLGILAAIHCFGRERESSPAFGSGASK
jgi:O-antigen ligase/polysaccharide polymerase Wzy-like membrane protein